MKNLTTSIAIENKMKDAYLNYSLSVIVGRALPDVRDGLKPVHRRILYAARDLGLTPDKPYKKSARIVGEVLGKYHPHGDAAVYNSMVRMAQNFAERYPLIDGHGNFGSIDGDSPAAMRYTEARLAAISMDLLADIHKETVEFSPNFDNSLEEPIILPSKIPLLLVNGSSGIAVGMSTDIPPHNLREVIDGLVQLLDNPETPISKLMKIIKGPDFPTGGEIVGIEGIRSAYETGTGRLTVRAKATIETRGKNREQIIVTEIPYQLQKAKLIEEIAEAVDKEKITNISDIRDESDRDGMRIVIELKPNANSNIVLNQLYKYTTMQTTYRVNMLALVGKQPKVLNLKEILSEFLDFRREVITRRTKYDLRHAEERLHILEGLKIAIDKLDLVIAIIRSSKSTQEARERLEVELAISEIQADAILKMQLQRLVGMEREKIEIEIDELLKKVASLKLILENKEELEKLIKEELQDVRQRYGDSRRTTIIKDASEAAIDTEDLIKEEAAVVTLSYRQYVKRTTDVTNARAGKKDFITHILKGTTLDRVLFFTRSGNCYGVNVYEIPEHHALATGDPLNNYLKIPMEEKVVDVIMLNKEAKEQFITIATAKGMVKKTLGSEYVTSYTVIKAINLDEDDSVIGVKVTDGQQNFLLGTKNGLVIHFAEEEVPPTGRNTKGIIGIKLEDDGDKVINFNLTKEEHYVIALTKDARGKRTHIYEYKVQKRNGKGQKTLASSNYELLNILSGCKDDYLILVTENGDLRDIQFKDITETQRVGNMYSQAELGRDRLVEAVLIPVVPEWVSTAQKDTGENPTE